MLKKIIGVSMCAVMLAGACGCNGGGGKTAEENFPKGEISYPVESDITLKYWVRLPSALGTSVKNYGDTEFAKEYMKRTGIRVEYIHPAQGQETEVLNLLISSGDLPDIIETDWLSRDPDSMIAKKTILPLNSYIEDYSPNLKKYLSENKDIDAQVKTDGGNYYVYPFIRGNDKLLSTSGFMLRGDWLKELGLEVPETMDEWEKTLVAFKKKCKMPIACSINGLYHFTAAYNTSNDFHLSDGNVVYGPALAPYKDFLAEMHKWYEDGIIDVNFAILDTALVRSNMLDGSSGATFGAGGGALGMYLNSKKELGEKYDLQPAPYPVLEKGQKCEFGNKSLPYSSINGAAITAKSKYPQLAARFLDYSYGEEGYMLNNFGIEGVSYEMKDGYPKYTDVVTNNPKGLSMSQALPLYVRAANEGPFVQDVRYIEQYYSLPQQQKALEVWGDNNHLEHIIPQITLTAEESTEYSKIMNEIETYRDEMVVKFIIGTEPIDGFDKFVEQMNSMGLKRATEIKSAAYARFKKR